MNSLRVQNTTSSRSSNSSTPTDSTAAARWFDGLEDAIKSLSTLPERGTATHYDPNLRFLLYGNKPHTYRILYRIHARPDRVTIIHVRHGARRPLAS